MTDKVNKQENAILEGKVDFTRQKDWFDPDHYPNLHVTMVGCGGIGSPTAFNLAKLGVPAITLIDFDHVEAHNLPNQMFRLEDIGKPKVEALKEIIQQYTYCNVQAVNSKLEDSDDHLHGIVISGLDSMSARAALWDLLRFSMRTELLIDGRIGGQDLLIHTIRPAEVEDVEYYEKFCMYSDEDGVEAPCTGRGIYDVGTKMASLITRAVRLWVSGGKVETSVTFNQQNLGLSVFPTEESHIKKEIILDKVLA